MIKKNFNGVEITVNGDDNITDQEIQNYIDKINNEIITDYKNQNLSKLNLTVHEDDSISVDYKIFNTKFERIRRITGYLTGTLDSWNNSKKSEEKDRVKHEINGIEKKQQQIAELLGIDMIQNVVGIERNCNNQIIHQEIVNKKVA